MSDYLLRAIFAIVALAALVGPLGSVAVWRKMGYFGDAASHAALLGVALSLLLHLPIAIGTAAIAVMIALYLGVMRRDDQSADGLLGVLAHGSLALAIILLGLSSEGRGNLEGYLFGNILTISTRELALFGAAVVLILGITIWRWPRLVYATLNEEMAAAHGIQPRREVQIYTLLLALAVAMGIQIVGALLMGAFLIIPAMAAGNFARSPESMAIWASVIALISGLGGFAMAYFLDIQAAPAMVVLATVIFFGSQVKKIVKN